MPFANAIVKPTVGAKVARGLKLMYIPQFLKDLSVSFV